MNERATEKEAARRSEVARRMATGFVLALLGWTGLERLGIVQTLIPTAYETLAWAGVVGALLGMTPLRQVLPALCALTAALLVLVGYTPLIVRPAQSLIRAEPPLPCDAVVVLSSWVNDDGRLDHAAFDRLVGGLQQIRAGYAPVLVRTWSPGVPPADADVREAADLLGRPVQIEKAGPVWSTHDEAMAVKVLYDRHRWRRVLLVTSPLHSKRSAATFRRNGVRVVSVPCQDRHFSLATLRQPDERYRAFREWFYEELAWAVYSRRGWV